MHQLVYISTARQKPSQSELENILDVSRRNNARVGVSGLLVSGGLRFLQALEGPTADVIATYGRISEDPRHFACVILTSRSVERRSFGSWAMAFEETRNVAGTRTVDVVHSLTDGLTDLGLQSEFRTFAEMHARAA